jgi:sec-independent protein translocase protein TatA
MGIGEILVVLVVVLLIFGANKIPQLGDALGKGIRNFKKATRDDDSIDVTPKPSEPGQLSSGAPSPKPPGQTVASQAAKKA